MIRPRRSSSRTPIRGLSSRAVTVELRASARTSACRTRTNCWIWGSSLWTIAIPRRPPAIRVDGIVQAPADVGAVQPGETDVQAVLHTGPAQQLVVGR